MAITHVVFDLDGLLLGKQTLRYLYYQYITLVPCILHAFVLI